jgi:hypothetical protein
LQQARSELRAVFQQIPTFGFGTTLQLQQAFYAYLTILVRLRKKEPDNLIVRGLIWKAHAIRVSIRSASLQTLPSRIKGPFSRASNELCIDIEYLLGVIQYFESQKGLDGEMAITKAG